MFFFVLVCTTLIQNKFCNHLEDEERAGCFAFIVYECSVTVYVLWLFLTVPWVDLQYVIVVFSDHTHLLFNLISVR